MKKKKRKIRNFYAESFMRLDSPIVSMQALNGELFVATSQGWIYQIKKREL